MNPDERSEPFAKSALGFALLPLTYLFIAPIAIGVLDINTASWTFFSYLAFVVITWLFLCILGSFLWPIIQTPWRVLLEILLLVPILIIAAVVAIHEWRKSYLAKHVDRHIK